MIRSHKLTVFILSLVFVISPLSAQTNANSERNDYLLASGEYRDGLYQSAEIHLRAFLNNYPNSRFRENASFMLGQSKYFLRDYAGTRKALKEFSISFPFSTLRDDAELTIAKSYFDEEQYEKSANSFKKIPNDYPDSEWFNEAAYYAGDSYFELGKFDLAVEYYNKVALNAQSEDYKEYAWYSLGWSYLNLGKYQNAVSSFESLISTFPQSTLVPEAKFKLGEAQYFNKQFRDAISTIDGALKLPQNIENTKFVSAGLYYKGDSEYQLGNRAEARTNFLRVIREFPDSEFSEESLVSVGKICIEEENYTQAVEIYSQLAGKTKDKERGEHARYLWGFSLVNSGKKAEGHTVYEELIKLAPESSFSDNALYDLASDHFDDGDFEKAYLEYSRIKDNYKDSDVYNQAFKMAGEVLIAQKKYGEAESVFADFIKIDASSELKSSAHCQLGMSQYRQDKFKDAVLTLQAYLKDYPNHEWADRAMFIIGDCQYKLGEYNLSIDQLTNLLISHEKSMYRMDAIYTRAFSRFRLGKYKEAGNDFSAVLNQYPKSRYELSCKYRLGDCYFMQKSYSKALPQYHDVVVATTDEDQKIRARFQKAKTLERLNRTGEAIKEYNTILTRNPEHNLADDSNYRMALIRFNAKSYVQAIDDLNNLLTKFPESEFRDDAHLDIGKSWYNQQEFQKAIDSFQRVLDRFPESELVIDALNDLQDTYNVLGRMDEAVKVAEDFARKNPANPAAVNLLLKNGDFYLNSGKFDPAITQYTKLIDGFQTSQFVPAAYLGRGLAYKGKGNRLKAIDDFWVISQKYPGSSVAVRSLNELGQIYFANEEFQQAENVFKRILREYKKSNEIFVSYLWLAKSQEALNKIEDAKKNYNQIIIRFSKDITADQARVNLGRILLDEGRGDQAGDLFKKVIGNRTNELAAEAKYYLGKVYLAGKNYKDAYDELRGVKYIYPQYKIWGVKASLDAGFCLEKLNRLVDAEKIYTEILENHPNDEFGAKAREALDRIK